jgi:putative ABC transport system substrate-binding protein
MSPCIGRPERSWARFSKAQSPQTCRVEQPTKYEMVVNLRAARALGVELPTAILLRADEVIE